ALRKYVGGHSDLLLGSPTVGDPAHSQALGGSHLLLGVVVSHDDWTLALRGLQTLAVRLQQLEECALARWLSVQPEIELVLYPALPSCPEHDIWRRDFTGPPSAFSVVFVSAASKEAIICCLDALTVVKSGYSFGKE